MRHSAVPPRSWRRLQSLLARPSPSSPVPLPSVCHAGPNARVPASVFPTPHAPAVFPAGSVLLPGGTRTCPGNPPVAERPVPPCPKDTNARVLLPYGLPSPRHVPGRCPPHPYGSRRARGLGAHPAAAIRGREQESYPAAPDHTRSSHPMMCTSAEKRENGPRRSGAGPGADRALYERRTGRCSGRRGHLSSGPGSRRGRARRT